MGTGEGSVGSGFSPSQGESASEGGCGTGRDDQPARRPAYGKGEKEMKGMILLGITLILLLIGRYEWWMIHSGRRKERAALIVLLALGWGLAVLLLYFPELPDPLGCWKRCSVPWYDGWRGRDELRLCWVIRIRGNKVTCSILWRISRCEGGLYCI